MNKAGYVLIITLVLFISSSICAYAAVPAFPGAEGFGAQTVGGRGGQVIEVINVNDTGAGSLRACIEASGPRICVFRVGGTIQSNQEFNIINPYLTIAAHTAPGDGILIRGAGIEIRTHDVIVQGIRIRVGDDPNGPPPDNRDALNMGVSSGEVYNIIIDHSSFSWATDENLSTWYANTHTISVQWNIISETLMNSLHSEGAHSRGFLVGDFTKDITIHHNLFAHNDKRNPEFKGDIRGELVNNVMYNWGDYGTNLGEGDVTTLPDFLTFAGNFYKPGLDSTATNALYFHTGAWALNPASRVYLNGNIKTGGQTDWALATTAAEQTYKATTPPFTPSNVVAEPAQTAYDKILGGAGASYGISCDGSIRVRRDSVDTRIVGNVQNGTGRIINSQNDVGGWPVINGGTACVDTDHDGMPDTWEQAKFGNVSKTGTGDADADGYTDLEEFLNSTNPQGAETSPTPTVSVPPTPTNGPTATPVPTGPLKAFPTAEGYGSDAVGGRGGTVMFVSNLYDSGAGSLRACATASGPRTCVFQVGGVISLTSRIDITNPFLTIAGQTAPGGGITVTLASSSGDPIRIATHDVIMRYVTIRPRSTGVNSRALTIGASSTATEHPYNVMIDHISTSWSEDEQVIAWYGAGNVTFQHNLFAEGIGVDQKGPNLGGGGAGGMGGPYTMFGNIIAFFYQRMPRVRVANPSGDVVDLVNNVIYNPTWNGDFNGLYLSDGGNVNAIGNYVKVAAGSVPYYIYNLDGGVYPKGNITPGRPTDSGSESAGVVGGSGTIYTSPIIPAIGAKPVVGILSATAAYQNALQTAGNSGMLVCDGTYAQRRDSVDARIVSEIQSGGGSLKSTAGQIPSLSSGTPCADSDHDGMSDMWEQAKFGNLSKTGTGDADADGYTDLEEFLNSTNPLGTILSPTPTGSLGCTLTGDIDCNNTVNIFDLSRLLSVFGQSVTTREDINSDGTVTIFDLSLLLSNFGR